MFRVIGFRVFVWGFKGLGFLVLGVLMGFRSFKCFWCAKGLGCLQFRVFCV